MGDYSMATDIGIHTTVNLPYEQAAQKTTDALKAESLGVLTQIEVKATLKVRTWSKANIARYRVFSPGERKWIF
jgi:uncharacterized protein (DUF302 family)